MVPTVEQLLQQAEDAERMADQASLQARRREMLQIAASCRALAERMAQEADSGGEAAR